MTENIEILGNPQNKKLIAKRANICEKKQIML